MTWHWIDLAGVAPLPMLGTGASLAFVLGLMVIGFAFLGAELFVIPGFGISGILGIASLLAGAVLGWATFGSMWGILLLGASLVISIGAVAVLLRTRAGKRLVLEGSLAGAVAVSAKEAERFLGAEGVAVTMLRPSGSAELGQERVEVETDGQFLPKGTRVRVVAVKLGRVVVEAAPDAAPEDESENGPDAAPEGGAEAAPEDESEGGPDAAPEAVPEAAPEGRPRTAPPGAGEGA